MKTTATVELLREQKKQCLHIIDVEKALTRLEANADFKAVCDFLFDETLINNAKFAYALNVPNEEAKSRSQKLAKALTRTKDYMDSLHSVAENCANQIEDIEEEIANAEAEEE